MAAFDPAPAARLLADSWRTGRQLDALPAESRPADVDQGYDVRDALMGQMGATAGWKLGVGSASGIRMTGLGRPLAGRLIASRLHEKGARVRLPNGAPVTFEFEIAFVLGRDIAPGARPANPMDAVAAIHTTFELVLSRFVDRRAVGWPSFAGDSVGFEALVVGDTLEARDMDAVAQSVVITADGREVARGLAGDDLTYPLVAFDYLIEHARARGATLKRGEIATLGAIGKPFDLAGSVAIEARYLGRTLRLTTETS